MKGNFCNYREAKMGIVVAVIITFVVTTVWHMWTSRANKLPLRVTMNGMRNELDLMSKQLGYEDVTEYWTATKGRDYAQIANNNFKNAVKSLE
jgi:hypothetical protein